MSHNAKPQQAPSLTPAQAASAIRLTGKLDPRVGRWHFLFKWLLAIPHFIVLFVLWIGFVLSTAAAGVAILFTGRYPRADLRLQRRRPALDVARRLLLL